MEKRGEWVETGFWLVNENNGSNFHSRASQPKLAANCWKTTSNSLGRPAQIAIQFNF